MLSNLDTYLEALRTSPLEFLLTLVYAVAVILISLILHECAHGYVAYRCGDPTAKMMGRLSLNPKAHLDLIGTLSMFLIGVGWAKPVPVNPRNFRHGRRDDFFVSIAGIATNLCLCLICMFLNVIVGKIMFGSEMLGEFSSSALPHLFSPFYQFTDGRDNVILSITNGIFAESALADFAVPWLRYVERFLLMMAQTNLGLALFNILPAAGWLPSRQRSAVQGQTAAQAAGVRYCADCADCHLHVWRAGSVLEQGNFCRL